MKNLLNIFSLRKPPFIIIFYGGHWDRNDYLNLNPSLIDRINKLNRINNNILVIMENSGLTKEYLSTIRNLMQNVSEEAVFNFFSDFNESMLKNYIDNNESSFEIVINGTNIRLDFSDFSTGLIDLCINQRLSIIFEKLSYEDYSRSSDFELPIPNHYWTDAIREYGRKYNHYPDLASQDFSNYYRKSLNDKWLKSIEYRERSFINQINEITENNLNYSIIIIRGSLHKRYYKLIKNTFKQNYKVKKVEYGPQVEEMIDF